MKHEGRRRRRHDLSLLPIVALGFVAPWACTSCGDTREIVESPPWTCDGTVSDESLQPLADVQIWVYRYCQSVSDSAGAYHAILRFERHSEDAIRFICPGYHDTLASLAGAVVVGDHRLRMDVTMRRTGDTRDLAMPTSADHAGCGCP
jgi:hypothetical protein